MAAWLGAESQDLKHADTLERAAADWQTNENNPAWLLEGTRLAEAETLAAQPGFRDRLNPTRSCTLARKRENDRIEADLQAAGKKQETAEAHAATLRKRSRVLVGVLAVTVITAVVADFLYIRADNFQQRADTRVPARPESAEPLTGSNSETNFRYTVTSGNRAPRGLSACVANVYFESPSRRRAVVMASPRPTSCALRSRAMPPSRGSDRDNPGRRCRHLLRAPAA